MTARQCVLLFLISLVSHIQSARILGVFTVASISHQMVFQPIWKELSLRGHEVTVLTPNPLRDPKLANLTEIDISFQYKHLEEFKHILSQGNMDHWGMINQMQPIFEHIMAKFLKSDEVQNFIKDNTTSYDVVLAEAIDPTAYAFAKRFDCPLIGVASLNVLNPTHEAVGTPSHPVLYPDFFTPYYGGDMSFFEKVDSFLFYLHEKYIFEYKYLPSVNRALRQYFDKNMPDIADIERNMSMLFLNTNPIIHGSRPYGPNVVEFGGGVHLKPQKPLPADLKSFLDSATEGVIYFSLGSNIKSIYLPEDKRKMLMDTFAQLPYKVLWKFEDDELKGKPVNVKISKWLPQQDVVRHPNIKLFITQAGLQSMEEALSNGLPLLALPFMADQHVNAVRIQKLGVGRRLQFTTLTEDVFVNTIREIIENPDYKKKAAEIGRLLKDQPMNGLEKVVWWTEYVIRNRGAPYLRSPRADVSWFDFLILDVVAFLAFIVLSSFFLLYKISRFVANFVFSGKERKIKQQ